MVWVSLAHYPGLGIAIKGMRIRLITLRLSSVVPSLIWFLPLLQTLVDLQSWQKLAYPDSTGFPVYVRLLDLGILVDIGVTSSPARLAIDF